MTNAMAEVSFTGIHQFQDEGAVREFVRGLLWQWIEAHAEDRVRLRIWIFRKDFKLSELFPVFEIVLGKRPVFIPT